MALTDTFVRLVKPGKSGGEKHTDGAGMYLLVKETGKYWRMNYRFLGKRKTLALGEYPEVSLALAWTNWNSLGQRTRGRSYMCR